MQLLPRTRTLVQGMPIKQFEYPREGKDIKDFDGFNKVSRKKRMTKRNQGPEVNKKPISSNAFDVLQSEQLQDTPDNDGLHRSTINKEADKGGKQKPLYKGQDMELIEDARDDMDIVDLYIDGLEKAVQYLE